MTTKTLVTNEKTGKLDPSKLKTSVLKGKTRPSYKRKDSSTGWRNYLHSIYIW